MEKYRYEKLSQHIYRIIDLMDVCCYLVIGNEKACLIDTCSGFGNIKEVVNKITDKPVFVILTHGHHDHTGGSILFDEVYLNRKDLPILHHFGQIDKRYEDIKSFLPNVEISIDDILPVKENDLLPLEDEQIFDLGGLHIKMICVKGHTPGMMCPLIIEERTIIFGDACGVAVMLLDEYSSCVSEYRNSLHRLKNYESEYDIIYRNHGTFFSRKNLLDNVIECCNLVLDKKDDHYPCRIHGFDLFAAKEFNHAGRKDGIEGNLLYILEKVK